MIVLESPRFIPIFCYIVPFICGIIHVLPILVDCCIVIYHIVHTTGCEYVLHYLNVPNNTIDPLVHYYDIVPFILM